MTAKTRIAQAKINSGGLSGVNGMPKVFKIL
jgi:hypothetical protein